MMVSVSLDEFEIIQLINLLKKQIFINNKLMDGATDYEYQSFLYLESQDYKKIFEKLEKARYKNESL